MQPALMFWCNFLALSHYSLLTQVVLRDGDRGPCVHPDARVVDELRRLVVDRDDAHVDHGGHARLGVRAGDQREAVAGGVAAVVDVLKVEKGERDK